MSDQQQTARTEAELLRGAIAAQDERMQQAGKRCGVPWEEWGCDWPDRMADIVIELRAAERKAEA
jgi:hypothetical protein